MTGRFTVGLKGLLTGRLKVGLKGLLTGRFTVGLKGPLTGLFTVGLKGPLILYLSKSDVKMETFKLFQKKNLIKNQKVPKTNFSYKTSRA